MAIFDSTWEPEATGTENEVNRDDGHQQQQPRRFCREVTSVVFTEIPDTNKGTEGSQWRSSIAPGNKKLLALKTKLTETTALNDSSHVASVEK